MIIATRSLFFRSAEKKIEIPIRVHAPEAAKVDWLCRFEIGWPEATVERWGAGNDAVQALLIAIQMVGAEIYASRYHQSEKLEWLAPGPWLRLSRRQQYQGLAGRGRQDVSVMSLTRSIIGGTVNCEDHVRSCKA